MTSTLSQFRAPLVLLTASSLLLGVAYPLFVKALIGNAWNAQVSDTAIRDRSGRVLASALDPAPTNAPRYFWGQVIDATAPDCYLDRRTYSPDCQNALKFRRVLLGTDSDTPVPEDLITFGILGQMPRISPEAAAFQIHRVALARGVSDAKVSSLVQVSTHNPTYTLGSGLYVNVLELNLRLDGKLK